MLSANLAAWVVLTSLFPGLHLLPPGDATPAEPQPRTHAPAPKPTELDATPADVALRTLVDTPAGTLFGPGFATVDTTVPKTARAGSGAASGTVKAANPEPDLLGTPFSRACGSALPPAASPAVAYATHGRTGHAGVTLQVWAYGAGQSAKAMSALRSNLDGCSSRDGVDPYTYSDTVSEAAAFVATFQSGEQGTSWLVWQRGDVLAALSYSTLQGAQASAAHQVAGRVDDSLKALLSPVCADLSPSDLDATRNPYASGYKPYGRDIKLEGPEIPPIEEPALPEVPDIETPEPVAHPELAVPIKAPVSAYVDLDGDGFAETPPSLADAQTGPAPEFADPEAFVAPADAVISAPIRPQTPSPAAEYATVRIPVADVTGPGCGWAFTGQAVPDFDVHTLKRLGDNAVRSALDEQAQVAAQYRADQLAWAQQYAAWSLEQARYEAYQRFLDSQAQAQEQSAAAANAYSVAAAEYALPRVPEGGPDPVDPDPVDPDPTDPTDPVDPDPTDPPTPDPTDPVTTDPAIPAPATGADQ